MKTDVVIVGGGPAGLLVANHLASHHIRCVVLEAGRRPLQSPPNIYSEFNQSVLPCLDVDASAWSFASSAVPYDWQRVRALGGRSLLWGGWCGRLEDYHLKEAARAGFPWPISLEDLQPHYHHIEEMYGVQTGQLNPALNRLAQEFGAPVLPKRGAVHAAGRRPRVATDIAVDFDILTEAIVTDIHKTSAGCVSGVTFLSQGIQKSIDCGAVVLCASPIESFRLLNSRSEAQFSDHMVGSYLVATPDHHDLTPNKGPLDDAAFIPRFVNREGGRRRDYRGGFTLEVRGPLSATQLFAEGISDLNAIPIADAASHHFFMIHAIGEVMPSPKRFLKMDSTTQDALGRATPGIHWEWDAECDAMARDMDETAAAVANALVAKNGHLIPIRTPMQSPGVGHESGTCSGLVDSFGKVNGVEGLYVADASVMPTGLDCHPTFTILALARRTAEYVAKSFR